MDNKISAAEEKGCRCVGSRTCGICEKQKQTWVTAPKATVYGVVHQAEGARLSSCSFPELSGGQLVRLGLCAECGKLFQLKSDSWRHAILPVLKECKDHTADSNWIPAPESVALPAGLRIIPNFISEDEETKIVKALDSDPEAPKAGWKDSQSGRRKQDFGPQANFKKRKVKLGPLDDPWPGVHPEYSVLQDKIAALRWGQGQSPFQVAQWSALDYTPNTGSNLDPHIDDTWIWGNRILGVSMLSDCVMSFLTADTADGAVLEVQATLPRRSMFIMEGPSRYKWLHGIRSGGITTRRISITIREFDTDFVKDFADISADSVRRVNLLRN